MILHPNRREPSSLNRNKNESIKTNQGQIYFILKMHDLEVTMQKIMGSIS